MLCRRMAGRHKDPDEPRCPLSCILSHLTRACEEGLRQALSLARSETLACAVSRGRLSLLSTNTLASSGICWPSQAPPILDEVLTPIHMERATEGNLGFKPRSPNRPRAACLGSTSPLTSESLAHVSARQFTILTGETWLDSSVTITALRSYR
jgi:hypothetical protein